nr:hypothetical protein CFP56_21866 [Quercus suber]
MRSTVSDTAAGKMLMASHVDELLRVSCPVTSDHDVRATAVVVVVVVCSEVITGGLGWSWGFTLIIWAQTTPSQISYVA